MQTIQQLLNNTFESNDVLKQLTIAHRYLGELKGKCYAMPNQAILINTLPLQEAQDSSHIENIITTQDQLFKFQLSSSNPNPATKEVANYQQALSLLYQQLQKTQLLSINMIIRAQTIIKGNEAGLRKQLGTQLVNEQTGETVYTPPDPNQINDLLRDLEHFMNDGLPCSLDPIIKMAIIHHQFESIHPFYDGNGRIGRIINIIYLLKEGLIDIPILYLSRYINHNKARYYELLQKVRDTNAWQEWLLYMIRAVSQTAKSTIAAVDQIKDLQQQYKQYIRSKHAKIYSQDLINNIFKHPYTKIQFLQHDLQVSRLTASRYLEKMTKDTILLKQKLGKENYYVNTKLVDILLNHSDLTET